MVDKKSIKGDVKQDQGQEKRRGMVVLSYVQGLSEKVSWVLKRRKGEHSREATHHPLETTS